MSALAITALIGFCSQANAQAQCPEFTRLRSEVAAALKQTTGVPTSDRCAAHIRVSLAWDAVTQYAKDHREVCDISSLSLNEFEKYHLEAARARNNVCAGRPVRPFPPDIIRH
jgi:hypothetical protein